MKDLSPKLRSGSAFLKASKTQLGFYFIYEITFVGNYLLIVTPPPIGEKSNISHSLA